MIDDLPSLCYTPTQRLRRRALDNNAVRRKLVSLRAKIYRASTAVTTESSENGLSLPEPYDSRSYPQPQ